MPWRFSGLPGGSLPEKMTQFLAQALLPLLAFVFTGSTYAIFTILDILFNEILFETTREYFYFRLSMTGSYKAAFLPESWQVYGSVLLRFGSFLDPSSHHDLFCDPPSYKIFQTWVSDPSEPQASQYTSRAFSSFPEFFLCLAQHGERERKARSLPGVCVTWLQTGVAHLGALETPTQPELHPQSLGCNVSGTT